MLGALAAWLHRAPRVLRKDKVISRPVLRTGGSILAGSTTAIREARAVVTRPFREVQPLLPQGDVGVHVDDISLGLAADTAAELRSTLVPVDGVICVLFQNGWLPLLPSRWLTPGKKFAANLDLHPGAGREVLDFFRAGVAEKLWAVAASHIGGAGLPTGEP